MKKAVPPIEPTVASRRPWTPPTVTRVPLVTHTQAGPSVMGDGGASHDTNG
jgi:hypothetical protein